MTDEQKQDVADWLDDQYQIALQTAADLKGKAPAAMVVLAWSRAERCKESATTIRALRERGETLKDVLRECSDYLHDFTEHDDAETRLASMCRKALGIPEECSP